MHVFCVWGPERTDEAPRLGSRETEGLDGCRRQVAAEVAGLVRCPRCGGDLVAGMSRRSPGYFCRCPVRRVRARAA